MTDKQTEPWTRSGIVPCQPKCKDDDHVWWCHYARPTDEQNDIVELVRNHLIEDEDGAPLPAEMQPAAMLDEIERFRAEKSIMWDLLREEWSVGNKDQMVELMNDVGVTPR